MSQGVSSSEMVFYEELIVPLTFYCRCLVLWVN